MTLRHRFALGALGLLLGACAQLPAPSPDHPAPELIPAPPAADAGAPATPATAAGTTPPPAAVDAAASAPPATASAPADVDANPAQAAGRPTDPLEPEKPVQLGTPEAEADLWMRIRAGFAMPLLDSDLVREHEQWYARRPDYVQRMTQRGSRYLFHILEEVNKRGMPTELALLPFIESAFNPQALSTASASGMWQFMAATGRDYDLRQNIFRDDRRDVLASTRAALDYLNRLHDKFGDWQLALAAYNCGEGNVAKAIARNQRAGLPTDYASLNLPMETRHYVPKLEAVRNIVADPERFSLALPELRNHPHFLTVPIQRDIDVALAARLAGMDSDDFKALNPQLNKPVILAAGTPQILLPYDNVDRFVRNLGTHQGALASWTAWVVPRTMRPAEAARQQGMSESVLREVNRIPLRMLVKAGSTLLVPRNAQRGEDVSEHLADNAAMLLAPDAPPLKRLAVKARKGDTVASIAQRYRVTAANVAQWNKISPNHKLVTGASLVVYVAPGKAAPARAVAGQGSTAKSAAKSADNKVGTKAPRVATGSHKPTSKPTVKAASGSATKRARAVASAPGNARGGN